MAYVNHLLTFIESNPALAVGFNLILLLLSGMAMDTPGMELKIS